MSKVRVKICGITRYEDLAVAAEAGADAVGFVVDVPSSPRNLTTGKALKLIKRTPIFVKTVAVTVPKNLYHITRIYEKLRTDSIQIHGDNFSYTIREEFPNTSLIRALQVSSTNRVVKAAIKAAKDFDAILLDSGKYGGTGKTHEWQLDKLVKEAIYPKPLILAGGLKPENVKEAICTVKPYAVDVSSGVESLPGIKDSEKIFEFIKKAKEVDVWIN